MNFIKIKCLKCFSIFFLGSSDFFIMNLLFENFVVSFLDDFVDYEQTLQIECDNDCTGDNDKEENVQGISPEIV